MTSVPTPQSICRFGIARCDITPPVGIYHRMWGAATHDRATGVHRPLTATAMVFEPCSSQPAGRQVWLALDHCLFWPSEMQAVDQAIRQPNGLSREELVITFSHTHAAGLMGTERVALPGGDLIPGYLEELGRRCAALIGEARGVMQEATIVYGKGRCTLAANRDYWDAERDGFVCGFNPQGFADDTLLVARVHGEQGNPLAMVVNYACHPTTLAWENTLISPDFPGAMREVVEGSSGVPCVFLQGASGDLGPREGFVGDVAVADRNGRELGFAALSVLEALPPPRTRFEYTGPVVSGATIGTWAHLPLDAAELEPLRRWQQRRWTIDLPYRADLPDADAARVELARCEADEAAALSAGDTGRARDARALAERQTRVLTRVGSLPRGKVLPYPILLWRVGQAIWVALDGEHYQYAQCTLRQRFPDVPLVVTTLAGGSTAWYLPTEDAYGQGRYQESASVLARGALETLIDEVGRGIEELLVENPIR